jgi:7-cyano-7-deazaguanine reductase
MSLLGSTPEEVRAVIKDKAITDLSSLLETEVQVQLFTDNDILETSYSIRDEYYSGFETLETLLEPSVHCYNFNTYQETPKLLVTIEGNGLVKNYHSALLKSNCRVTSQPDWGDVFISYKPSDKDIVPLSLLQYIVSFRDECHFHEEICETIYKRLHDVLKPEWLSVKCLYARRGGIDINPERASDVDHIHFNMSLVDIPHIKTPKQASELNVFASASLSIEYYG